MTATPTTIEIHDLDHHNTIEIIEIADQISNLDYINSVSIDAAEKSIVAISVEFDSQKFSSDFNEIAHEQFGYKTTTGQTESVFTKLAESAKPTNGDDK